MRGVCRLKLAHRSLTYDFCSGSLDVKHSVLANNSVKIRTDNNSMNTEKACTR